MRTLVAQNSGVQPAAPPAGIQKRLLNITSLAFLSRHHICCHFLPELS